MSAIIRTADGRVGVVTANGPPTYMHYGAWKHPGRRWERTGPLRKLLYKIDDAAYAVERALEVLSGGREP